MIELCKTERLLGVDAVIRLLESGEGASGVGTGHQCDLSSFCELTDASRHAGQIRAHEDQSFAHALHAALRHVDPRTLLDMRTWHWLCLGPMRGYTLARWCDGRDDRTASTLAPGTLKHFVGSQTMNGVARNAGARLYWVADISWTEYGDYSRLPCLFGNTDLFTGIFERRLGLERSTAVYLSDRLAAEPEKIRRDTLRDLNLVLTTTVLEFLTDEDLAQLVDGIVHDLKN